MVSVMAYIYYALVAVAYSGDFDDTVLARHTCLVWYLLMLSLLLTATYIAHAVYVSDGIPESVSAHVYRHDMSRRWYYTAWMWVLSLTFAPALFLLTPYELDFAPHVLVTSLLLTSVLPLIERDGHGWHRASTVLSAATCTACVYIVCKEWLILWMPAVATSMYFNSRVPFIVQVTCVASLLGSLITRMLFLLP